MIKSKQLLDNCYKVPSVSIKADLPVTPFASGIWQVTQRVRLICVLPVRNSPNTSVMDMELTPPPSNRSNSSHPVLILKTLLRREEYSDAVTKPHSYQTTRERLCMIYWYLDLCCCFFDLINLGFRQTFDLSHTSLRQHIDSLHFINRDSRARMS